MDLNLTMGDMTFSTMRMPDSEQLRESTVERLDHVDDDESEMMETQRTSAEEDPSRTSQEPFQFSKPHVFRNTGHRLYYNGVARQMETNDKLRSFREQTLVEEAQLSQRPAITQKALMKPSKGAFYAEHADMWSKQRDANIEHIRRAVVERELHVCPGTPFINDKSLDIVENNPDYKHPVHGWHDRFTQYIAKKHEASTARDPGLTFTPNINSNAPRRDDSENVSERLYEDADRRKEGHRKLCVAEWNRRMKDASTGQPLFQPLARHDQGEHNLDTQDQTREEMFERLHDNAHERTVKLARRQEQKVAQDGNLTFTPVISKTSQVLATRIDREPLHVPKRRGKSANDVSVSRSMSQNNMTLNPGQEGDFYLRSQHLERERLKRLEKVQRERDAREQDECTFQPRMAENSRKIFMQQMLGASRSVSRSHPDAQLTVYQKQPMQFSRRPKQQQQQQHIHYQQQQPQYLHDHHDAASETHRMSEQGDRTPMRAEGGPQFRTPKTSRQATPMVEQYPGAKQFENQPIKSNSLVDQPSISPQGDDMMGSVEGYVADFQRQMQGVLSEWKKLEEES